MYPQCKIEETTAALKLSVKTWLESTLQYFHDSAKDMFTPVTYEFSMQKEYARRLNIYSC